MDFTPRDITRLTGVQPGTLREWRRQTSIGKDLGRQEGSDRWRYSATDALTIWMIARAREEGAGVMRAWQVAFWCLPAVEHYLGARIEQDPVKKQVWTESAHEIGPRFAIFPPDGGNPAIVGDLTEIADYRDDKLARYEVWDLQALARAVPERLPLELRDIGS